MHSHHCLFSTRLSWRPHPPPACPGRPHCAASPCACSSPNLPQNPKPKASVRAPPTCSMPRHTAQPKPYAAYKVHSHVHLHPLTVASRRTDQPYRLHLQHAQARRVLRSHSLCAYNPHLNINLNLKPPYEPCPPAACPGTPHSAQTIPKPLTGCTLMHKNIPSLQF